MITWASIATLVTGTLVYASNSPSILMDLAELGGVVALFALVCAAEAFSEPKS